MVSLSAHSGYQKLGQLHSILAQKLHPKFFKNLKLIRRIGIVKRQLSRAPSRLEFPCENSLAEVHLHFLCLRTVAGYNDLSWHICLLFMFCFYFYHSLDRTGPVRLLISKISTLYFFIAALSFALRARGLINNSISSATIGFFVKICNADSSPRLLTSFRYSFTNRSSRL